ncbi:MAG: hypothetical protein KJZ87_16410, partial [Thermoguttaceae bacterium]|nr:hypothetical protein [Thermoguttaceae bacterium]
RCPTRELASSAAETVVRLAIERHSSATESLGGIARARQDPRQDRERHHSAQRFETPRPR